MAIKRDEKPNTAFIFISIVVMGLLVTLDRVSKYLVSHYMVYGSEKEIISRFFKLNYIHNTGISMGMFGNLGMRYVIAVITAILIGLLIWVLYVKRPSSMLLKISLVLIIAGGIGNLVDRLVYGYVIDYFLFEFKWFPYIFNVADCYVVIGGALIVLFLILDAFGEKKKNAKTGN